MRYEQYQVLMNSFFEYYYLLVFYFDKSPSICSILYSLYVFFETNKTISALLFCCFFDFGYYRYLEYFSMMGHNSFVIHF